MFEQTLSRESMIRDIGSHKIKSGFSFDEADFIDTSDEELYMIIEEIKEETQAAEDSLGIS